MKKNAKDYICLCKGMRFIIVANMKKRCRKYLQYRIV